MAKTFAFYETELIRLQSEFEVSRSRGDDAEISKIRGDLLDKMVVLANDIVGLGCRDLSQLRAKMLFVREFSEPEGIGGALVLSLCRDIEAMLRNVKAQK